MFRLHVTCSCLWMRSHMPNPIFQTTLYSLGHFRAEQDSNFKFSFLISRRGFWKASSPKLRELWNPWMVAMRSRHGILAPTSMLVLHTYDVHMVMHLILSNITKLRQFLYLYPIKHILCDNAQRIASQHCTLNVRIISLCILVQEFLGQHKPQFPLGWIAFRI